MSETKISAALRRIVIERAAHRCEYCGVPDTAYVAPHEPDHVIVQQHGGKNEAANLAYACFRCNRLKGPNLATLDPISGLLIRLYNPRTDTQIHGADTFYWWVPSSNHLRPLDVVPLHC